MSELKPCPFCDGESSLVSEKAFFKEGLVIKYAVVCPQHNLDETESSCHLADTILDNTKEEAIKRWNTRPVEQTQAKRIEELEALVGELVHLHTRLLGDFMEANCDCINEGTHVIKCGACKVEDKSDAVLIKAKQMIKGE